MPTARPPPDPDLLQTSCPTCLGTGEAMNDLVCQACRGAGQVVAIWCQHCLGAPREAPDTVCLHCHEGLLPDYPLRPQVVRPIPSKPVPQTARSRYAYFDDAAYLRRARTNRST